MTTASNQENKLPTVSTLHFDQLSSSQDDVSSFASLPSELLKKCLVEYADWGDLARLSATQTKWSSLLNDAAETSGKWELAQAMLDGTNGMAVNPARAIRLLKELAGVSVVIEANGEIKTELNASDELMAPAMKRLATCYLEGNGVEQQNEIGLAWLEAAHELAGDVNAAHDLALIYEYGHHSVEIDVYKAAEYFEQAAEGGHIEAMAEFAMCCELGAGTDQDDQKALDWYMKAANAGHVTSKYSVAEIFEEARGVPQSDSEACLWYYRAACCGDEDSKRALRRLYDVARIVLPNLGSVLEV